MTSATHGTIDRRDAAITAGLAGAVLVVVGYASGIGLQPAQEVAATIPQRTDPPAAAPALPDPPQLPAAVPPPLVAAPVPVPPPASVPTPTTAPTPTEPAMTMPSESPSTPAAPVTAAPEQCSPGLLTGLVGDVPLIGGLTEVVTGLASGLLGPVLGPVAPQDASGCTTTARASDSTP